jgi:hypothetical protein
MRKMIGAVPALAAAWEKWGLPFFDRTAALSRLRTSNAERQSLLISGPAGIGKTALVMKALREFSPVVAASTIYLSGVVGLQDLLRALLRQLHEAGDPTLRRQMRGERVRDGAFKTWLKSLGTSRLKGALYRSMEQGEYTVILDHFPPLTPAVAKVVRELVRMRSTPVVLLDRGFGQAHLGHVADLYWADEHRLSLGPLPEAAARALLESCIHRFELERLKLGGFRSEVLRLSGRVPGSLIKMCALAAQPRYQYGSQIKTKLIRIDSLVSACNLLAPSKLSENTCDGR